MEDCWLKQSTAGRLALSAEEQPAGAKNRLEEIDRYGKYTTRQQRAAKGHVVYIPDTSESLKHTLA